MIWLIVPLIVAAWCVAGQQNKVLRPILVPIIGFAGALLFGAYSWWTGLPILLYGIILTIGYGEHSKLMQWLKNETLVRLVFSLLCCIPILLLTWLTWQPYKILICFGILGAFQIRGGSIGHIGKYDILLVDILRATAISSAIAWCVS